MIDNSQNQNFNSSNNLMPPPVPPANSGGQANTPKFQASPSGGVVATLQPGQKDFNDVIRKESERSDNLVNQHNLMNHFGVEDKSTKETVVLNQNFQNQATTLPNMPAQTNSELAQMQTEQSQVQPKAAPASVGTYKVGAGKPKKEKKNLVFPLVLGAVGLIAVGGIGWYFYQKEQNKPAPKPVVVETTVLDYWGLWEQTSVFTQVLKDFEAQNPGVSVRYQKKAIDGYRGELQDALETGNGPDVFRYHASWRSYLQDQLSVLPETMMTTAQFGQTFYPVMSQQLKNSDDKIQGVPLMYDSLALIYNKDAYLENKLEVPKTWGEFKANAMKMTKVNQLGQIEFAGAAMGLANNVDFASDIVGLLAAQSEIDLTAPEETKLQEVINYYIGFYVNQNQRVWDESFENSTIDFARGQVGMILAPSWLIHDILAINPNLNLGVASVPQLNVEQPTEWATYWVEGVNNKSPRQQAAWNLLEYLSSESVLQALNREQETKRMFGEIYPRPAMADLLASNMYVQPYLVNADKAIGFPLNDKTFDQALDDANKAALLTTVANLTEGKQRTDVIKEVSTLVKSWQKNLNDYGYLNEQQ